MKIKLSNIYFGLGLGISWHEWKTEQYIFVLLPFIVIELDFFKYKTPK